MALHPVARRLTTDADGAGRDVVLIGMRDDGGIKERGGLERIFVGEIGADEKGALIGKMMIGRQKMAHRFKALEEIIAEALVAAVEIGEDLVQHFARPRPR